MTALEACRLCLRIGGVQGITRIKSKKKNGVPSEQNSSDDE